MTTDRLTQVVAHVRPMMSRDDLDALLIDNGLPFGAEALTGQGHWPLDAPCPCEVNIDDDGVVTAVDFTAAFGRDVALNGIRVGQSEEALWARNPAPEAAPAGPDGLRVLSLKNGGGVRHLVEVDDGTVTRQWFEAEPARLEVRRRNTRRAEREAEAAAETARAWSERTHGFAHKGDPAKRLRAWAATYESMDADADGWASLAEWLIRKSTPADRHAFVHHYNWDHGFRPLEWIASRRTTELATVYAMFWQTDPGAHDFYRRNPDKAAAMDLEAYDFLWELRQRIAKRFYRRPTFAFIWPRQRIAYEPDRRYLRHKTNDRESLFPARVFKPIRGRQAPKFRARWPIPIS